MVNYLPPNLKSYFAVRLKLYITISIVVTLLGFNSYLFNNLGTLLTSESPLYMVYSCCLIDFYDGEIGPDHSKTVLFILTA